MKKIIISLMMLTGPCILIAQNLLEGYAPVASPSGAYKYIRTVSETQAAGSAGFDIVDIKANAKLTNTANTTELKVYGKGKAINADLDTLNVGSMSKTTGEYAKAKINKTDTSASYTIQDKADIKTYRAELDGADTSPTLNLSNTKAFPNALPNSGLLSTIGKNMEWKTLKDTGGVNHTILVINVGSGGEPAACAVGKIDVDGVCKTPCTNICLEGYVRDSSIGYLEDGECCKKSSTYCEAGKTWSIDAGRCCTSSELSVAIEYGGCCVNKGPSETQCITPMQNCNDTSGSDWYRDQCAYAGGYWDTRGAYGSQCECICCGSGYSPTWKDGSLICYDGTRIGSFANCVMY
ncbi:hypothetical protein Dip518_000827 [Parelusimicrobium proximum]|uniref:hypothetical protein n=1 Tax=Parelusimicrobium proximum TaxID=3228953 RepID=UPI003D17EE3F